MSINFYPANSDGRALFRCKVSGLVECLECAPGACDSRFINLSNVNAADLMRWVGLESAPYGQAPARDVAALCRRRLWPEARNNDPALPSSESRAEGRAPLITCGRREGYLRERTEQLLALADAARDQWITWS